MCNYQFVALAGIDKSYFGRTVLNRSSHNYDNFLIETISNYLQLSANMNISKVTFDSLSPIGLVGQVAWVKKQAVEWTNEEVICVESYSVDLVARSPIFVKVDGTTPAFTQGGLPSVRDQVIANKFELDGTYTWSDFTIEELTIQSICIFMDDDVSDAHSCDFELEFPHCNSGRGGGGVGRKNRKNRNNGNQNNEKVGYINNDIFAKG